MSIDQTASMALAPDAAPQAQRRVKRRLGEFNVAAHGLRGIASVLVLLAHIIGGTARHIYPHDADYVRWVEHPWYLGTFGVEIFFVISGYVILASTMKYSLGEFALRRFVRLYPLFLVFSFIFIALNAITNSYEHVNNAKAIVAGLLFLNLFTGTEQLTPNAWSLTFEVCFYVLTALVVTFAFKKHSFVAGALAVMASIAFLISFPITIYFLIGVALRLTVFTDRCATRVTRMAEMVSLAFLFWFASRDHFDYSSWMQFLDPVVPGIVCTISIYFFFALMPGSLTAQALDGRIFRYVGDVSYSLYLVHPFVYFALRWLFVRFGWFTDDILASMLLFSGFVVLGSFIVTNFVHILFERWPYRAVFHQRVYRKKDVSTEAVASC